MAPFTVERQKNAKIPDQNVGSPISCCMLQRLAAHAHVIGVKQLVAVTGVGQARVSSIRLPEHWQAGALVDLQPRCGGHA